MPLNSALYYRSTAGLNFGGRTDRYLRNRNTSPQVISLQDAKESVFPLDLTGVAINEDNRDAIMERLNRYREGNSYYEGDHFTVPYEEGEKKTVFNFCKIVVDKGVDWHLGKGWKIVCHPGNEWVADYLNLVWEGNDRNALTLNTGQFGAITGDSYMYVTARTTDQYGRKLPSKKWTVRLQSIAPQYVTPVWSDVEPGKMKACLIQQPVQSADGRSVELMTIWITPDKISTWIDMELHDEIENVLGEVNVVHIPNFGKAGSAFGDSDLSHIIPVNVEYNITAYQIRRIIKYHAEPTTVVYGARASQLEKGASSVWSGLPVDGRIENLDLQSDLGACFQYLASLRELMSELSNTPKIAFDVTDKIPANVSAAALELAFQPLLEKTRRRQIAHKSAVQMVNRLIIAVEEKVIGNDLSELADYREELYATDVEYTTPLPRDEAVELDMGIKRQAAGVWSRAELVRRCSRVPNIDRLILELLADKRQMLAEAYEQQRALNGERPSSLVAFLGSESLTTDVEKLMSEVAILENLANKQTDVLVQKEKPKMLPAPAKKPVAASAASKKAAVTVTKKKVAKAKP